MLQAESPIVFIHLGNKVPSFLFTTIKQARYFNPSSEIYLLLDSVAYDDCDENKRFFREEKIEVIDTEKIPRSREHREFDELNTLAGFALHTLERFLYLHDFIREKDLKEVVHLENDCMIYTELKELSPGFKKIRIGVPFLSKAAVVPCFVFIENKDAFFPLIKHILMEMQSKKTLTDMRVIAGFYEKYKEPYLSVLPTLMKEYSKRARKSACMFDNFTPLSFLSKNGSLFPNCVFDAATYGIFLNGNDRKVFPATGPGTVHYRSLFDPRFFSFFWRKDEKGRKVPCVFFAGKEYKIVNLHFHSKMPEEYVSYDNSKDLPVCSR